MSSLLISRFMVYACDFLVMCYHWHGSFPRLTIVLSLPWQFLDIHGVVGLSTCFFYWHSCSLWLWVGKKHSGRPRTTWFELLVLDPRLGQTFWSPWWFELLVPRARLDKRFGDLEGCGLSY